MASLTLSNVPESLYSWLAQRASQHGTSVGDEALTCIQSALENEGADAEEVLADIRAHRESITGVFLTDPNLQAAKEEGRASLTSMYKSREAQLMAEIKAERDEM